MTSGGYDWSSKKREALRLLAEAAEPYGLRVEQTAYSMFPDFVLVRASDGREAGRLRWFDTPPRGGPGPVMSSLFPHDVSPAEQIEVEAHMAKALIPVILEVFSYPLWVVLAKPDDA